MRTLAVRGRGALLRGRSAFRHRRVGGKKHQFGARSPDGEAQVEQPGAVAVGPGHGSAERGPARSSPVPAETAPVHGAHRQHSRAGQQVLPGKPLFILGLFYLNIKAHFQTFQVSHPFKSPFQLTTLTSQGLGGNLSIYFSLQLKKKVLNKHKQGSAVC